MNVYTTRRNVTLVVISIILAATLWMVLSGPVLMKMQHNPLARQLHWTVFNPLRDRSPERAARTVLRGIHSQHCSAFLKTQPVPAEEAERICIRQARDPLTESCKMVDSIRYKDSLWVSFQCQYQRGGDSTSDVSVTLARNGFALKNYERIY